ncbi:hypothetical protein K438DRAFT_1901758 [Mycena galopus ATCC 62051]|nr:hypothetical protein K438DRAFT_1901758 [Mycena galopus ATCC 62051]
MEIMAGDLPGSTGSFTSFTHLPIIFDSRNSPPSSSACTAAQKMANGRTEFVGKLSPGAYFLRRDLFPSIVSFIKAPDTEIFTFEAILLLSLLANFHKSKQNPYIQRIQETEDKDLMRKICWASNFALDAVVKNLDDDTTAQTLAATLGSMMAKLRPDRALAPVDPPRELFKSQPIEACVVILPVFEFLRTNPSFPLVLISPSDDTKSSAISSPPYTILSLSSYLLTHASSTSSPRAIPNDERIRLCRQRLPVLPVPPSRRPPLCALIDCCVLWLRHNLHKRLEVQSYITSIWVLHRIVWFLEKAHIRLGFLPTPEAIHQFVYELVRSAPILEAQVELLKTLALPQEERRASWSTEQPAEVILARLLSSIQFYQTKVAEAHVQSAKGAMRVVATEIDRDGLQQGMKDVRETEPPGQVPDVTFSRFACSDILSLMP